MKKKLLTLLGGALLGLFSMNVTAAEWTGDITNGSGLGFTTRDNFGNPGAASGSTAKEQVFEIWTNSANAAFDLNQAVTNIPDGIYELSANAMYRASLTYGTATNCVLYATVGDKTYTAAIKNYGDCTAKEDLGGVANAMVNHKAYGVSIPYIVVEGGVTSVTIGMKNTSALTFCTNGYWFIYNKGSFTFKNVTAAYYEKLSTRATAMIADAADGEAKTALQTALSTYATATVENIKALKAAINTYLWTAASDTAPIDVTSYMVNPTFDDGSLKFWMQDFGYKQAADLFQPNGWDLCYASAIVNNTQYQTFKPQTDGAKDGYCLYVRHRWGDVYAVEDLRQFVKELPAGKYSLTVAVKGGSSVTDANTLTLSEGSASNTTTINNFDKSNYKDYSVTFIKKSADTDLGICYGFNQQTGVEQLYYIDDFRLKYHGEVVSDEDAAALIATIPTESMYSGIKDAIDDAKTALEASKTLSNYNALAALISEASASIADYQTLKDAIDNVYAVVNPNYTDLATAIEAAQDVYDNGSEETCASTIAALDAAVKAAKVADYTYVMGYFTEDASLGIWKNTYDTNTKTAEGYDTSTGYYDLWSASATPAISQTVTLPAGEYALIGIGRGQEGKSTEKLSVKIGDGEATTVDFLMKGNTGLGVNTSGQADFTEGDGHVYTRDGAGQGWEYRFILFTLTEESSVTLGANATLSGSWAGVYPLQVKTTAASIKALKITEINALAESAPTSKMQASVKSTLDEKLAAAEAASTDNTKEQLQAIYDDLKAAVDAANASVANYKALNSVIATSNACYNENAEGAATFSTAISAAQTAYTAAETDATSETATIKSALKTYVDENAIEMVVNGTFDTNKDGWSSNTGASGQNLANNKTGDFTDNFWENWNSSPKTGKMSQKNAAVLPAGDYVLQIAAFGDQAPAYEGSNLYVFVNNQKTAVISDVPTYYYVPFTLTEAAVAGTVEYGLVAESGNKSGWIGIDNVSISYVSGKGNFLATETEYAALTAAITAAEAKTLGFEVGEYAPYNNIDAAKALAVAKAIDQEADNSKDAVEAATTALTGATWTANTEEVNAVYDGSFNLTTKTDGTYILPIGWTNLGYNTRVYNSSNMGTNEGVKATSETATMFAKFTTEYGTEAGYTMPLKKGVYYLSFIYGGWNEVGTREIKVYNALKNATVTPSSVTAKDSKAHTTTSSWSTYSGLVEIPEDGDYILSFYRENTTSQNQICISDIELKKAASANMTITAVKWGTFVAPFDVTIPADVEAYTITGVTGGTINMESVETTIIANTPVLVYSESEVNKTFYGKAVSGNPASDYLVGVYEPTKATAGSYILMLHEGKAVFGKVVENDEPTVGANRCYLNVPGGTSSTILRFGDATGIQSVEQQAESVIYDLTGRRVDAAVKGIYIVNGKKMLVK